MRPKSLLLLALALGCGLVASIGISQVMDRNSHSQGKLETLPIYVATHNINLGDPIDASMLSLDEWPKDKVPRGAISNLKDLEGRRPRTAIIEGEPILEGKLLAAGQIADPISAIKKGMRLKTIAVDAEKSAAGLLKPGDRVDVQLYVKKDARNDVNSAKSKIILQNIRVFAVDQAVQRGTDGGDEKAIAKTVSLMLTPEQASKLALAEQIGEISLVPRNPDDEETAGWSEYTVEDLLGDGDKNSRAKEQGTSAKAEPAADPAPNSNLLTAIQNTAKEPFRMEIVEAQALREVLFDAETGKPLNPGANAAPVSGPTLEPKTKAKSTKKELPPPTPIGEPSGIPDEFPINLDALKKN